MQKEKNQQAVTYQQYADNYLRRTQLRKKNLEQRQEDFFGGERKTSKIKIIQKFISKLKADAKNYQSILSQLDTLNMSKYLQEVSNIIVTSVTEKQINFYTQVATKLNTQYENVSSIIIKDLVRVFNQHIDAADDNKSKIKAVFLLAVELFVCGFSFSYKQVIEMIKKVFKCGKNKKASAPSELQSKLFIYSYSCTIFSTLLLHYGQVFTKRRPIWLQDWEKEGKKIGKFSQSLPLKTKEELTLFFAKYVAECFSLLKEVAQRIKAYESELFQCLRLDGQFNKQTERNYTQIIDRFTLARRHLRQISAALNQPLELEELETKITPVHEIMARYIDKAENACIFQDQFQREIYENIPELVTEEDKNATDEKYKQFKPMLDSCKNVNDSNEICKAFNLINSKKNRKNLVKDVLEYRKEYHLVTPYLCRVVAIVNLRFRDIGEAANDLLFTEYEKIKETSASNFVINDKKSRIMKYICELTKFKVIDVDKCMSCIENLIDNLNGYNIELIVLVLESVGRFLHLSENSANKFTFLIKKYENIIKKKSLPILTTSQLINSINLLKPRKEVEKPLDKEKTPEEIRAHKAMSLCINNQIHQIISEIDVMMKTEAGFDAIKVQFLKKVQAFDFLNSYNYAYLLQELNYSKLSNFVVERTIQNVMLYLAAGQNQKTILWAKFLGQLYKYKLFERPLLFSTIENTFKVRNNEIGVIHTFCHIFQACIGYLDSKKVNMTNQRFMLLVKFKKFLCTCKYIAMLEEFQILEIFDLYEPDLAEIDNKILDEFILHLENKIKVESREFLYSNELDRYLAKKNLKKYEEKPESKDTRNESERSPEKTLADGPGKANFIEQTKEFDKEFNKIMEQNRKDFSGRITKPIHLQKVFDKKKEKKKDGPCITVIARSGNRFFKKDVAKGQPSASNNKIQ